LAINFSGEFTTPRSPEEVFDFLSDPGRFAPLLPDYQSMSMQDATHFTVKVKVGVGNIRGSAELKMELTEAVKPQRAQYKGQGTAVGSQVNVIAGFDLEPNGSTTKVVWKGETSVFGKLASMAGGMLEPLGRKNIQKLIEGLQKALSEPTSAQSPSAFAAETPSAAPASDETPTAPLEVSSVGVTTPVEASGEGATAPVEAPGFSPVNTETKNEGASAPAHAHGDNNA
jgi:uncharacterized protein